MNLHLPQRSNNNEEMRSCVGGDDSGGFHYKSWVMCEILGGGRWAKRLLTICWSKGFPRVIFEPFSPGSLPTDRVDIPHHVDGVFFSDVMDDNFVDEDAVDDDDAVDEDVVDKEAGNESALSSESAPSAFASGQKGGHRGLRTTLTLTSCTSRAASRLTGASTR